MARKQPIPSHPAPPRNLAAEAPQKIASPEEIALDRYRSIVVDQAEQLFTARSEVHRVTQFNINANAEIERLKAELAKLKPV